MKKITLLMVSLLLTLGGVKSQNLSNGKDVTPIGDLITGITQEGLNQLTDGIFTNYYNFSRYVAATEEVSEINETQSWYIDLGEEKQIGRITIHWEGACAKQYKVYGGNSTDNINNDDWGEILVTETECAGGAGLNQTKTYTINNTNTFRYVKFKAEELFEKTWGCKMGEFVVKGTQSDNLTSVKMFQIYRNTGNVSITPELFDEDGLPFTGEVTYTCQADGFSSTNNVLNFNNTPDGVYSINISDGTNSIEKKIAFVSTSPEDPTESLENVRSVFCDKYSQTEPGISDPTWNWGYSDKQKIEISSSNYAYLVSNVGTYGLNGGGDADVKKLLFDIYVVENTAGHVVIEGTDYTSETLTFAGGEWNHFSLDLPEDKNFTTASWIQFYIDGDKCDILLDNVLYTKEIIIDDGKDPVIEYADVSSTTAASATFNIVATDNSEDLTFKVVATDEHDNQITCTANGKSGNTVYVTLKGLDINTAYTATVTISDKTRTSEEKVLTFTTKQLPHAIEPNASTFYYQNNKEELRGFLAEGTGLEAYGGFVDEINIGADDNVLKFSGKNNVFGLNIKDNMEFNKDKKDNIVGIAIYPIDITEIQVAPRIWQETDNYKTIHVNANEWNYITIKPLENYTGNNSFIGFMIKGADGNTVFVDNFYMYTSDDVTAPTVTLNDISDTDVHVNSVQISFSGSDETSENVKYEIWLKNTTDGETEYQAGFTTAANNKGVTYYLKGLKAGKEYNLYVRARDDAENAEKSEIKTFTTKSFSDDISISNSTANSDNGGIVVLNGKWNVKEFNKIAAEYPYGCFDVRNVQFEDNIRHDRGKNGIKLFNHNAYFITDIGNNFDGNYAIPDEEGKLIGMNFQWFDGDFTPTNGPTGYVDYNSIISNYKTTHSVDTYPGLSDLGYIKMDPYTGYDLYFKEQGASITRQMYMNDTVTEGETGGSNRYSTMICPFALNTDKVENCDFFRLNAPSVGGETVTLNFTQVTGKTEANKPYLIRVKTTDKGGTVYFVDNAGDTEKKLSFTDIENKKEIDGKTAEGGNVRATLFGTYVTQTFYTETTPKTSEVYGLKQNNDKLTLISSTKRSVLPAFRAAVKITDLPTRAKYIVLSFDGETTGISSIGNDTVTSILGNVYSIDGKIVGNTRNGLVHLPAGIYIVNGKKVVIK